MKALGVTGHMVENSEKGAQFTHQAAETTFSLGGGK